MADQKKVCIMRGFVQNVGEVQRTIQGDVPLLRADALTCRPDCVFMPDGKNCEIVAAVIAIKNFHNKKRD